MCAFTSNFCLSLHGIPIMDTTREMLAFLAQLKSQVAEAEQNSNAVSDDEDEEPKDVHQGNHWKMPLRVEERTVSYTNGDSYTGSMLGDQRHGQGTHTCSTGDVYSGSWQYDLRQGRGTFKAASGAVYEGDWVDDKACGSGRCTYPDGSVYEGVWDNDERCGWGCLTTADGQVYEGEWAADTPHGQGQWVFADGLSHFKGSFKEGVREEGQLVLVDASTKRPAHTYTGKFKDDQRHGSDGVGVEEGLWVYRGEWQQDHRWGHGHCRYADGRVYEGQWVHDKRHGTGCLTNPDGTTYEGQWQDDLLHGVAKAKYASGEVYVGHWHKGLRHGHGKWTSAPKAVARAAAAAAQHTTNGPGHSRPGQSSAGGSAQPGGPHQQQQQLQQQVEARETYVGSWVSGKREGQGVAQYADGGRYEGSWKCDQRHGHGLMVFADGVVFRGDWRDDEWLQSAAEPALCRMSGPGLTGASAGQTAEFVLQARDELSNLRLTGGDSFQVLLVPSTAQRLAPPTAEAQCMPAAGQHVTHHQVTHYQGSQLTSSSSELRSFPVCIISSSGGSSAADASSSDSSSGASIGTDDLPQTSPVVEAVAEGLVQDNGDGTYSCSYRHDVAGWYELHVTNGEGEHVAGSPCRVYISAGEPSARHSSVTGPGRRSAIAGCNAQFDITFRDAFGNPCGSFQRPDALAVGAPANCDSDVSAITLLPQVEARLVGSNTVTAAEAAVSLCSNGTCSCSYTAPAAAGLYVLEVTAGGKHVGGSPFPVKVLPTPTNPQTLSAAAADRTAASTSSRTVQPAAAAHGASPAPTSSTDTAAACHSTPAGTGSSTSGAAGGAQLNTSELPGAATPPTDKLRWWGDVARQAYAAIDGCLLGFDEPDAVGAPAVAGGLTGPEADMVKANPKLPVVERLEDLWLLSRLQQERKAKEQQHTLQQHKQQQQQHPAARTTGLGRSLSLKQQQQPPQARSPQAQQHAAGRGFTGQDSSTTGFNSCAGVPLVDSAARDSQREQQPLKTLAQGTISAPASSGIQTAERGVVASFSYRPEQLTPGPEATLSGVGGPSSSGDEQVYAAVGHDGEGTRSEESRDGGQTAELTGAGGDEPALGEWGGCSARMQPGSPLYDLYGLD